MSSLTDVPGVRVGHATDRDGGTGCTVVLFDRPALGGIDIGGGYASTRQADSLRPGGRVRDVHGFLLTGGSAFGMEAATGCMAYLEERGVGFATLAAPVPSVPTAVLYDLALGPNARPDAAMGRRACEAAGHGPVAEGNVGAGTGCSVAKRLGMAAAWKGGLGSLATEVRGYAVGALVAVNAVGDVYDPDDRTPVALARGGPGWLDPLAGGPATGENTTLAVVCTDAPFGRNQLCFLARMAMNGMARSLSPPLTPFDGDLVFTATTATEGRGSADDRLLAEIGEAAMELVARSIVRGVRAATSLHGLPGVGDP